MYYCSVKLILTFTITFFPGDCSVDTIGTAFYVLFMENQRSSSVNPYLYLSLVSAQSGSVVISNPRGTYSVSVFLNQGLVHTLRPPSDLVVKETGFSNGALYLVSTEEIVVYASSKEGSTCGAFSVFPADVLDNEYIAAAYWAGTSQTRVAEIGLVSLEDNNDITLSFVPQRGQAFYNGVLYDASRDLTIQLDQYQAFQLQGPPFIDLSGTYIRGTGRLAVFAGNNNTNIIGNSLDHVMEQMQPYYSHGTEYIVLPIPNRNTGDRIKIIATRTDTLVYNAGGGLVEPTPQNPVTLTNVGSFFDSNLNGPGRIYADKPIVVAQFSESDAGLDNGAPSMMMIVPVEQYKPSYRFVTDSDPQFTNYIAVIVNKDQYNEIRLDGNPLSNDGWLFVPTTDWVYQYVQVAGGVHTLLHIRGEKFGGWLYGIAPNQCAYSYTLGQCFLDIAVSI